MEILSDPVLGVWDPVSDREHQFYSHPSLPPCAAFHWDHFIPFPLCTFYSRQIEKKKHFLVSGLGHRL